MGSGAQFPPGLACVKLLRASPTNDRNCRFTTTAVTGDGAMNIDRISQQDEKGRLRAVLESPQGSRHKYKYDATIDAFTVSTTFPAGMSMPFDFGFFPSTRAPDAAIRSTCSS